MGSLMDHHRRHDTESAGKLAKCVRAVDHGRPPRRISNEAELQPGCSAPLAAMPPSSSSASTITPARPSTTPGERRFPVTPVVLREIFASSRTAFEERSLSRVAFFRCVWAFAALKHMLMAMQRHRFTGFLISCIGISLAAARGRPGGIKSGVALLGGV
jgi:hypothetical protein